jgi:transposase
MSTDASGFDVLPAGRPARPRIDGRRLSHEASEVIRRLAVRRVEAGERPSDVIASYGLCRTTIYRWIRASRNGGTPALARRKHPGRVPLVSENDLLRVREWIIGHAPRDYGLPGRLWTRRGVAALLHHRLGISMTPMNAGRLLRRMRLDARSSIFVAHAREMDGPASLLFALNPRGAFLCRRLDGVAPVPRVQRTMDALEEAAGGGPVIFGVLSNP